jgi:hypothetical protein
MVFQGAGPAAGTAARPSYRDRPRRTTARDAMHFVPNRPRGRPPRRHKHADHAYVHEVPPGGRGLARFTWCPGRATPARWPNPAVVAAYAGTVAGSSPSWRATPARWRHPAHLGGVRGHDGGTLPVGVGYAGTMAARCPSGWATRARWRHAARRGGLRGHDGGTLPVAVDYAGTMARPLSGGLRGHDGATAVWVGYAGTMARPLSGWATRARWRDPRRCPRPDAPSWPPRAWTARGGHGCRRRARSGRESGCG